MIGDFVSRAELAEFCAESLLVVIRWSGAPPANEFRAHQVEGYLVRSRDCARAEFEDVQRFIRGGA